MSHSVISLDIDQEICEDEPTLKWSKHMWIHIFVFGLAVFSIYLCWKHFFDTHYWYSKFNEKYVKPNIPVKKVDQIQVAMDLASAKNNKYKESMRRRLASEDSERFLRHLNVSFIMPRMLSQSFHEDSREKQVREQIQKIEPKTWVNKWNIVALISNLFQLSGTLVFLFEPRQRISGANNMIGIGCFFAWVNIMRYFQYDSNYFFMFSAIQRSFTTVTKYLLGAMTIFVGYAIFGSSVFWQSHRFESASRAITIQFALLDGDSIYDTFADLTYTNYFMGQFYLYTFIILFICVVQNLFISIIQKVYSDDRRDELKAVIEKERSELLEAKRLEEQKNKPVEEIQKPFELEKPRAVFTSQVKDLMEMLDSLKIQYKIQKEGLAPEERKNLDSEYENAVNMVNKKISELGTI